MHVPFQQQGEDAVQTDGGLVVYPNALSEVDMALQAMPAGGVRIMTVIKGGTAPTEYAFDMKLPAGTRLVPEGGGFAILLGHGERLATIAEPWALDANGKSVPVKYTLKGTTLIMNVDHAGAAYPVVADPYYGGGNDAEMAFCAWPSRWSICNTAWNDAQTALAEAQRQFPGSSLHNDAGDAFRHCYWSALMTIHFGSPSTAKTFGDLHEDHPNNPPAEKAMDLFNNEKGRAIGVEVKPTTNPVGNAISRCKAGTTNGLLQTRP